MSTDVRKSAGRHTSLSANESGAAVAEVVGEVEDF
jgi:hypothetical protein